MEADNESKINRPQSDDGSLAFLDIQPDPQDVFFNCKAVSQQQLVNRRIQLLDFTKVETKFSKSGDDVRYLVHIKTDAADDDYHGEELKFFTNSREIKHTLDEVKRRNAFPRWCRLKVYGTRYFLS